MICNPVTAAAGVLLVKVGASALAAIVFRLFFQKKSESAAAAAVFLKKMRNGAHQIITERVKNHVS